MMIKKVLFVAVALTLKSFTAVEPPKANVSCQLPRCTESTSIIACNMLVGNIAEFMDGNDLISFQTMVVATSTVRYILLSPYGCVDSGALPYLENYIPFFSSTSIWAPTQILNSTVQNNGQVIVETDEFYILNSENVTLRGTHMFDALYGGCRFYLMSSFVRQSECQ